MAPAKITPTSALAQDHIVSDSTQISALDPEVRRLTVSYGARNIRELDGSSASAASLRLRGAWLKRAGFAVGVQASVRVSTGRLVIEVAEPERVSQAEVLAKIARVSEGGLPKRDWDRFVAQLRRGRRRRHR